MEMAALGLSYYQTRHKGFLGKINPEESFGHRMMDEYEVSKAAKMAHEQRKSRGYNAIIPSAWREPRCNL